MTEATTTPEQKNNLLNVINCEGTVLGTFGKGSIDAADSLARESSLEVAGYGVEEGGSGKYQRHGIVVVSSTSGFLSQFHNGKRLKK